MNIQIILCVEADKRAQTDNMYIKQTISKFYKIGNNVKISFINMGGKTNYKKGDVKRKVKQLSQDYRIGSTVVVYCIDLDYFETNSEQANLNKEISSFLDANKYEMVWFCHEIEEVFVGKSVDKSEKTKIAINFVKKEQVNFVQEGRLMSKKEKGGFSNLLLVLDNYLDRKKDNI